MLKSRKHRDLIAYLTLGLTFLVLAVWKGSGPVLKPWDFQVLDFFYKQALKSGQGPQPSPLVVYLAITDETYPYFGKNELDRADLARMVGALAELEPQAVGFDMIFARPGRESADTRFAESLKRLGTAYLPVAFSFKDRPDSLESEGSAWMDNLQNTRLGKPVESGTGFPFSASRVLTQAQIFARAAHNSGHINAHSDHDGVYRHFPLVIRVGSGYFPALPLSMFLDYAGVPFDRVRIDWGNNITIPALEDSFLEEDVVIPIDRRGRVFIPFVGPWSDDFPKMTVHSFLKYFEDENVRGNLLEFFEGKFVFVLDVSNHSADFGQTPLEDSVPKGSFHPSILTGMLTHTFYDTPSFARIASLLILITALFGIVACLKTSWPLYVSGAVALAGIVAWTWYRFREFELFPVVTLAGSAIFVFAGLVFGMQIAISRERNFIRGVFSKYLPETVIRQLLDNPELVRLGGERREITLLFSDLADFTSITERTDPEQLATLLNHYFTEMTRIVNDAGGIINQYIGDAIMAIFGAPLPDSRHAGQAVQAGLEMQKRLSELRQEWQAKGLPEIKSRIGINSGSVIVGNMGSQQMFYYTALGDAVNLAARLEGANKRYGTELMISENTFKRLDPDRYLTRVLDVIQVKGKTRSVKVFEVYGWKTGEGAAPESLYHQTYQEAFEDYLNREFTRARDKFAVTLKHRPGDIAAQTMIRRINDLNPAELTDDWDGAVVLTQK